MSPNRPRVFEFDPLEDRILLNGDSVDAADIRVDPDAAIADPLLADLTRERKRLRKYTIRVLRSNRNHKIRLTCPPLPPISP